MPLRHNRAVKRGCDLGDDVFFDYPEEARPIGKCQSGVGDPVTPAWVEFGKAVQHRQGHEALGTQDRKSYVCAVEKGQKRLSALTLQNFATF